MVAQRRDLPALRAQLRGRQRRRDRRPGRRRGPACAYLAELGVDAIWFNPWYPSPMSDAGYDISDYRGIEPVFGTLADADALISEAHAHRHQDHHRRGAQPRAPTSIRGSPRRWRPGRGRRSGTGSGSGRAGVRPATSRRTTGSRSSAAPPGPGSPSRTARPASGTCTCSRREQPDFNWANAGRPARVRGRAAVLVRPRGRRHQDRLGRAADQGPGAAGRRPTSRRVPGTRSPTATTCTTSTGPGGPSRTSTPGGC